MNYFLKAFKNTFNYKGRARRAEFGWFQLVNFFINLCVVILIWVLAAVGILSAGAMSHSGYNGGADILAGGVVGVYLILNVIMLIYGIVVFFPGLSLTVRRLHDFNWSGWWVLILGLIVPLVVFILPMIVLAGQINSSGGGQSSQFMMMLIGLAAIIYSVVMLAFTLMLFFRDGNRFANKYGEDPKLAEFQALQARAAELQSTQPTSAAVQKSDWIS